MKKNIFLFSLSFSFLFILGLFLTSFVFADTAYPDCSSVSGYSLIQGETCSINVKTPTVFNFKALDPDGNNLTWSINWGDKTSGLNFSCPSNLPNSNLGVSHSWASEGTYNVRLGVSNCKGGEAEASFNIVVEDSQGIDPNIVSDIVVLSQDWPDKIPWTLATRLPSLKFEVKNTGVKGFSYNVSYGKGEEYTTKTDYYDANLFHKKGNGFLDISFSTKHCGPRKVKISLNPDKKIVETDYTNNSFEKIVDIDCTSTGYDFDMIMEKVGIWPTTVLQGKDVSLGFKFSNLGEKTYRFEATSFSRTDSTGTHQLNSGGGLYASKDFSIIDQPICGNNHYVFKINDSYKALETNKNNNEISGDVFVDCSKKPDFVIEKVGTWPTTVKSGSKPIFYFTERNIGEISAGRAGTVRMTVNGQYEAGFWYYGSLGVGSSTGSNLFGYQVFSSPPTDNDWWIPICSKGDKFTLRACADNACGWGSGEIEEVNENNNILTHEVTCE